MTSMDPYSLLLGKIIPLTEAWEITIILSGRIQFIYTNLLCTSCQNLKVQCGYPSNTSRVYWLTDVMYVTKVQWNYVLALLARIQKLVRLCVKWPYWPLHPPPPSPIPINGSSHPTPYPYWPTPLLPFSAVTSRQTCLTGNGPSTPRCCRPRPLCPPR